VKNVKPVAAIIKELVEEAETLLHNGTENTSFSQLQLFRRKAPLFFNSLLFRVSMPDRSFKIDKWVWSDSDFGEMSWHDVVIHGLATRNEMLSGPDEEPRVGSQELLFDIDYLINWRDFFKRGADFWISPATLVFSEVSDLSVDFRSVSPLLWIYTIGRKDRRWTISMDDGQIAFDSAGFTQYIRREPISKSHFTYLSDSERGGFSFRRNHD
jgi:hypothetical protein